MRLVLGMLSFVLKSQKCCGKVPFHFMVKAWDVQVLQQRTREGIST